MELLVRKVRYEIGHFGWSFVLAKLQEHFWVLRGQARVRKYFKKCTFCPFRNAKSSSQMMAALPKERLISVERAFHTTGCDFFGPIFLLSSSEGKLSVGVVFLSVSQPEQCTWRSVIK